MNDATPLIAACAILTGGRACFALMFAGRGQVCHNSGTSKEVGLEARNVGATTAPSNEQRFFHFPSCAGHDSLFGGPCGAFARMRRSYVRSSNLHGLPPHLEVRGRFQTCNVGVNHD